MRFSKAQIIILSLVVTGLVVVSLLQRQAQTELKEENQSLRQLTQGLTEDNERLTNRLAEARMSRPKPPDPSIEMARLQQKLELLRQQTNELLRRIAIAGNGIQSAPPFGEPPPADYPKTIEDCAKGIFEALKAGDADKLLTYYSPPGATRDKIDAALDMSVTNEEGENALANVDLISVGEPTNRSWLPTNTWLVPCRMRLPDGQELQKEILIGQDPGGQRWYFLGGMMQ